MTDNEILRVFKYCQTATSCIDCQWYDTEKCENNDLTEKVLGIINRQKAEIEKLKVELKQKNPYEEYGNCVAIGDSLVFTHTLNDYDKLIKDIEAEAIKEFAKRLKNKIWYNPACNRYRTITPDDIYDLVKEMTGSDYI